MKYIDWKLTSLVAFACLPVATSCAGSLDTDQNFSAGRAAWPAQTVSAGQAGRAAQAANAAAPSPAATTPALSSGWSASPDVDAGQSEGPLARADAGTGGSWSAPVSAAGSKPAAAGRGGAPAAGAGGVAGLPAAGSGTALADAAVPCDFRGLVQMKCGNATCHGAPASSTGLNLTSASLATRVEGRKGVSACTDKLLIDKAQPEQSLLYLKVNGTSCGTRMPLGGTLTASEQACFLSWIEGL